MRAAVKAQRLGLDPFKMRAALREVRLMRSERRVYEEQRLASARPNEFTLGPSYWVFGDRDDETGEASGHYFHQDLIVAQEIFKSKPVRHVAVASSIYGLVSHIA